MTKELKTSDYMPDGWDRGPYGSHPYKRGSRHNKIGMWIMWIFYVIVGCQIVLALSVIPIWPIPVMMGIALSLFFYVVITAGGTN